MLKKWIFWRLVQIVLDFFWIYGSFLMAYFFQVGFLNSTDFSLTAFALVSFLITFLWSGLLFLTKYYRIPVRSGKRAFYDIGLIILGGFVATGAMIVFYLFAKEALFSRMISVYAFSFGVLGLCFSQIIFRKIFAWQKKNEKNVYRTLIVGVNRTAERIIAAIEKNPYAPYKIIGAIDPYGLEKKIKGSTVLGKLNKLETLCDREEITAIIQCDAFEHTLNLISLCEEKNIQFQFDPALRGIYEKNLRIREISGQTMISFVKRDFKDSKKAFWYRWGDKMLRQVFDID